MALHTHTRAHANNAGIQTQTAECLVIGEITTKHLIVVLNKVDLLKPEVREEKVKKVKAKLSKVSTLGGTVVYF